MGGVMHISGLLTMLRFESPSERRESVEEEHPSSRSRCNLLKLLSSKNCVILILVLPLLFVSPFNELDLISSRFKINGDKMADIFVLLQLLLSIWKFSDSEFGPSTRSFFRRLASQDLDLCRRQKEFLPKKENREDKDELASPPLLLPD
uniref:Uncharacterized protein n=1 Tax=Romanomermis culicivorax TaxID=13658 RepID=A0A915L829_ROMCU